MNAPIRKSLVLLTLASSAALSTFAATPEGTPYTLPQPPFYGQIRPRTEFDSKDIRDTSVNKGLLSTHLRTRLGFVAAPSPKTEVKVEMQDVRVWGSELPAVAANPATSTIANSKGVDLLQGYFAIEEGPFKTAFGRQKMQLGAGRFLSTLEWSPTSRSFDGWSFNLNLDPGNLTGLAYLVRDTNITTIKDHVLLSGLYYSHQINPDIVAEAYGFYDQSRIPSVGGAASTNHDLMYYGEGVAGKAGMFTFEEEFIYQGGELTVGGKAVTSAAWQLATRLGAAFGTHKVNAGVDIMSGDKDAAATDDELNTYRANYYFAHMYFGWMDYFVVNPRFGVIDYRLDASLAFLPNAMGNPRVTIKPEYHFFTPQNAASLPAGSDEAYGQEIDLEVHLALYPKSNIVLGAGIFMPGDGALAASLPAAKRANNANSTQNGMFLYFMPVFNF